MRGILGLLTVVSVVVITLLFIAFGSRGLEKDVQARIENVKKSEEYRSAVQKIDELRARMMAQVSQLTLAMQDLSKDFKKQADPKIAEATKEADELVGKIEGELQGLNQNLDKSAASLKEKFSQWSQDARTKAVEGYQKLEDELDKLETSIALTMMALRSAFKKGAEEFEAQKGKLQEHLKKISELKKGLNPETRPLE